MSSSKCEEGEELADAGEVSCFVHTPMKAPVTYAES